MIVLTASSLVVPYRAAFDDDDHERIGAWVVEAARQADRYHHEPAAVTAAVVADRREEQGAGG